MSYYSFNIPLLPKDIMRMAKTFEFTNNNYLKKNPDVFENCLTNVMVEKTKSDKLDISKYITTSELKKIKYANTTIFANVAIIGNNVPVPQVSENFKLKKEINILLEEAHERTKTRLAEMRKSGVATAPTEVKPIKSAQKPAQEVIAVLDKSEVHIERHEFDINKVPKGNFTNDDFSIYKNPIMKKHSDCVEPIQKNYARRDEDIKFLRLAVAACKKQIAISAEAAYWFLAENEYKRKHIEQEYGMSPIEHFRKIREERGLPPPDDDYDPCGMPEHTGYKQLCIICEKQGFFDEVINICEQAKLEGWRGADWDKKIEKAKKVLASKQ